MVDRNFLGGRYRPRQGPGIAVRCLNMKILQNQVVDGNFTVQSPEESCFRFAFHNPPVVSRFRICHTPDHHIGNDMIISIIFPELVISDTVVRIFLGLIIVLTAPYPRNHNLLRFIRKGVAAFGRDLILKPALCFAKTTYFVHESSGAQRAAEHLGIGSPGCDLYRPSLLRLIGLFVILPGDIRSLHRFSDQAHRTVLFRLPAVSGPLIQIFLCLFFVLGQSGHIRVQIFQVAGIGDICLRRYHGNTGRIGSAGISGIFPGINFTD